MENFGLIHSSISAPLLVLSLGLACQPSPTRVDIASHVARREVLPGGASLIAKSLTGQYQLHGRTVDGMYEVQLLGDGEECWSVRLLDPPQAIAVLGTGVTVFGVLERATPRNDRSLQLPVGVAIVSTVDLNGNVREVSRVQQRELGFHGEPLPRIVGCVAVDASNLILVRFRDTDDNGMIPFERWLLVYSDLSRPVGEVRTSTGTLGLDSLMEVDEIIALQGTPAVGMIWKRRRFNTFEAALDASERLLMVASIDGSVLWGRRLTEVAAGFAGSTTNFSELTMHSNGVGLVEFALPSGRILLEVATSGDCGEVAVRVIDR